MLTFEYQKQSVKNFPDFSVLKKAVFLNLDNQVNNFIFSRV